MTTNKPLSVFELNDDILSLIGTQIKIERQTIKTKKQKSNVMNQIENIFKFFIYEGYLEDCEDGEIVFAEWLFWDTDNDNIYIDNNGIIQLVWLIKDYYI